jgi:flavorubredoxin
MRPFKRYVLQALELIEPLNLNVIAPTHGPILRDKPRDYVRRFRELASSGLHRELNENEKSLLIFYISSYGNTARMAESIHSGASTVDGVRVSLYDLEGSDIASFVDLIEEADGIVFGSPTINGDAAKPVWDLLSSLAVINTTGKLGAAFGSFGWSGEAVRMMEDRMRGLKLRLPVPGVRIKLIPTDEELAACQRFGQQIGRALKGELETAVVSFEQVLQAEQENIRSY